MGLCVQSNTLITETTKMGIYQVHSGFSLKMKMLDNSQHQEYRHYYGNRINNTWTPIFTQYRETIVCNCRAVRAQFPLIPAAAVTIHKCQGSTLWNVVVDMDVSPSPYYAENLEAAKNFYQHAHYAAASRVPSLSGLQIIDWSPEYMGVNKRV